MGAVRWLAHGLQGEEWQDTGWQHLRETGSFTQGRGVFRITLHEDEGGHGVKGLAGQHRLEGGGHMEGCGSSFSYEVTGTHIEVVAGQML